jgi:2-methylcitrate dehydratase PrpD
MGITSGLAAFAISTELRDAGEDVRIASKEMLLNIFGVTLAGSVAQTSDIICAYSREVGSGDQATLLGRSERSTPTLAALVNGTMAHVLDFDEHVARRGNHPSNTLMPTVLAVGEQLGVTGAELLAAFIVGCEVSTKIGAAGDFDLMKPTMWSHGWHLEGVACTIGATAAAGKLLGLNQERMENALGIAVSEAAGVQVNYGTSTKSLHSGRAAMNGVMAASLAAKGFTGARNALEDENGLLGCYRRDHNVDADEFLARVGNPYDIIYPGVGIKPYPCASSTHTAIDAVHRVMTDNDVKCDDIESLVLKLPPRHGNTRRVISHPETGLEGKFSIQYCAAVTMVHGAPRMDNFTDEAVMGDGAVAELLDRVTLEFSETVTPDIARPATATIVLKDGSRLAHRSPYPKGHPKNAMSPAEIEAKFLDCARGHIADGAAREVVRLVDRLEELDNLTGLASSLSGL